MDAPTKKTAFLDRYGPWALVAGASAGLGAEYARQLAARGFHLALVARREDRLQALTGELAAAYGIQTRAIAQDLALPGAAEAVAARVDGLEIGLLVANAGYSSVGPFFEAPLESHLREIYTNCRAPLELIYRFGRPMMARGRGGIVLMASLSAWQGSAWIAGYAAAKAYVLALAEGLWDELAPAGVDVLAVCPSAVKTPGYLASQPARAGRFAPPASEPADVAREALGALGRQPVLVPGAANRAVAFVLHRLLPRRAGVRLMGRTLRAMYAGRGEPDAPGG